MLFKILPKNELAAFFEVLSINPVIGRPMGKAKGKDGRVINGVHTVFPYTAFRCSLS